MTSDRALEEWRDLGRLLQEQADAEEAAVAQPRRLYVLMRSVGEYSDRRIALVRAYATEEAARSAVEKATAEVRRMVAGCDEDAWDEWAEGWWSADDASKPGPPDTSSIDPGLTVRDEFGIAWQPRSWQADETRYWYEPVEVAP